MFLWNEGNEERNDCKNFFASSGKRAGGGIMTFVCWVLFS